MQKFQKHTKIWEMAIILYLYICISVYLCLSSWDIKMSFEIKENFPNTSLVTLFYNFICPVTLEEAKMSSEIMKT